MEESKLQLYLEGNQLQSHVKESQFQLHMEELLAESSQARSKSLPFENFLLVLAIVIGTALLVYPSASNYWNSFRQTKTVMRYAEYVANLSDEQYAAAISAAEEYNRSLAETGIDWDMSEEQRKTYKSLLDLDDSGVMGYIDVPKINVKLPIYHGTSPEVLQVSIGHLEQTSLPVGGGSSHCVLSGHRGLPRAELFSQLDKMVEGDTFTLSVLNETYTYKVDRIRVVEPKNMTELKIMPGEDLCTLVTCTPYGVNSHRLLVRGHRIENLQGNAKAVADAMQLDPVFVAPFLMIPLVTGLLLMMLVKTGE